MCSILHTRVTRDQGAGSSLSLCRSRSRQSGLSYASGTGIDYSYDTASRLLDVNNVTDTGQLKYAYSYDDVGNRLSMSVTDSSGTKIHLYDYDNIYQITDVNNPEGFDYLATDTTFNYDEVGNRTSVVDDDGTASTSSRSAGQEVGKDRVCSLREVRLGVPACLAQEKGLAWSKEWAVGSGAGPREPL